MSTTDKGAKWLRVDLHVHTPFDRTKNFKGDAVAATKAATQGDSSRMKDLAFHYFDVCAKAELDLIAVTDHNAIEGYAQFAPHLAAWRAETKKKLRMLPGVEFTVGGERILHVLLIADEATPAKWMSELIASVFETKPRENERGEPQSCQLSVRDFNRKVRSIFDRSGHSYLLIPAHINRAAGLDEVTGSATPSFWLEQMRNDVRERAFAHSDWAGFQTCGKPNIPDSLKWAWAAAFFHGADFDTLSTEVQARIKARRHWPFIEASDPDCEGKLGTGYTWLKMTEPSLEGVRLALLDPESRLRSMKDGPPAEGYPTIESIQIQHAKHVADSLFAFSTGLSTLIGGRGSGKSTIIEFARWGLDRNREEDYGKTVFERIGAATRELFQIPTDRNLKGLFELGYRVETKVRVHGQQYEIVRDAQGCRATRPGDGTPHQARTLLQPRIFSQRQLAAIAEDPAAMRHELDALLEPEEGLSFEDRRRKIVDDIGALQRRREALEKQKAELPGKHTDLQLTRDRLSVLEGSGKKETLTAFQQHQKETTWILALDEELRADAELLLQWSKDLEARCKLVPLPPPGGAFEALFVSQHAAALAGLAHSAAALKSETDAVQELCAVLKTEQLEGWQPVALLAKEAYESLKKDLAAQNVDFSQHEKLLQRRYSLEKEIEFLGSIDAELKSAEAALAEQREGLVALHEERMTRRQARAQTLTAAEADIRITLEPFGDRTDFRDKFSQWLAGTNFRDDDWTPLVDYVFSGLPMETPRRLLALVKAWRTDVTLTLARQKPPAPNESAVLKLLGPSGNLSAWFLGSLKKTRVTVFDDAERFLPDDGIAADIRQEGPWQPLSLGSLGQKATAILGLVLSSGNQPLIIDQPEDDLDNRYIYDVVVDLLRKRKFERQIIVATHNANVPVNGDAELIVALEIQQVPAETETQIVVAAEGSIDVTAVKQQVSDIMEGSREAFRLRQERYNY